VPSFTLPGREFSTASSVFLNDADCTIREHTNFEESTEVIKPLTEEEKKAKLSELRERWCALALSSASLLTSFRLAAKRDAQATVDRQEAKKNEAIRRKKTQDSERMKEELRKKEQLREVDRRKREKIEDVHARERVKQQIKEQQEARKIQAERDKAAREGKVFEEKPQPQKPAEPKVIASHSESRLQLRLPGGRPPLVKTFPAETTLFEVASAVETEKGKYWTAVLLDTFRADVVPGFSPASFTITFPRKVFQKGIDFGQTLKEAGMVPSCALLVN
jgi:hypothetical protein